MVTNCKLYFLSRTSCCCSNWGLWLYFQSDIIFNDAISVQHAYALEVLKDHLINGTKALDVGSGSGYLTVCMALMVTQHLWMHTYSTWMLIPIARARDSRSNFPQMFGALSFMFQWTSYLVFECIEERGGENNLPRWMRWGWKGNWCVPWMKRPAKLWTFRLYCWGFLQDGWPWNGHRHRALRRTHRYVAEERWPSPARSAAFAPRRLRRWAFDISDSIDHELGIRHFFGRRSSEVNATPNRRVPLRTNIYLLASTFGPLQASEKVNSAR